ncbi:MAG TPA: hypothetical protein PKA63_04815 [Oligoflexia bacterium]|nr:hypothetical protein [Oligoflexia bacterium]HMP47972.1 hypothetical protein [Oligoflexia bacterium]
MDYELIKEMALELFKDGEKYLEGLNWFYIGGGVFIILLLRYMADGLKGSTVSPVFLLGVMGALIALLFIVMSLVPGLAKF